MKKLILNAKIRNTKEKTKDIRNNKMLPAVVYGKTQESTAIQMDYSEFLKLFRISGESHIINLKLGKNEVEVLVHDIQKEPVSGDFTHIDFYAITRGKLLTTNIVLNFIGEASAAKEGALIEEHIKEIEIKCLPKNLVDGFDIDLSKLKNIGDTIRISDLNLGENFEIITNNEDVIVSAAKPAKEIIIEEEPTNEEEDSEKENNEEEK